jgi:hypothetical protein
MTQWVAIGSCIYHTVSENTWSIYDTLIETRFYMYDTELVQMVKRISGVIVSLLTSSAVDRGFQPRSSQIKNYEIGNCCFSAKHTTVNTFVRSSALFETAWEKSTAPFMVPWVRPNPEDMTKWVIHAEVLYIETISGDTNSYPNYECDYILHALSIYNTLSEIRRWIYGTMNKTICSMYDTINETIWSANETMSYTRYSFHYTFEWNQVLSLLKP